MIDTISGLYVYIYLRIIIMFWWKPMNKNHSGMVYGGAQGEESWYQYGTFGSPLKGRRVLFFYLFLFKFFWIPKNRKKKNQRSCKKAAQLTARLQLAMPLFLLFPLSLSLMQNINPKPSPNNHMHTFKQSNPQPK